MKQNNIQNKGITAPRSRSEENLNAKMIKMIVRMGGDLITFDGHQYRLIKEYYFDNQDSFPDEHRYLLLSSKGDLCELYHKESWEDNGQYELRVIATKTWLELSTPEE